MNPYQEFIIETDNGKIFQARITEEDNGSFHWDYWKVDPAKNDNWKNRTKNTTTCIPFKEPKTAFKDMTESIIKFLEEEKDEIIALRSASCKLISLELQRQIISDLCYYFPAKVNDRLQP